MLTNLTPAQLRKAASIKEQIEALNQELASLTGISAPTKSTKPAKRKISAAHIAKIRAAQKLRWAKFRAGKSAKKKISAAGIARIKAAQKARWAKIKGAKKQWFAGNQKGHSV